MYHLWRVPDLDAAVSKIGQSIAHNPASGVIVPFGGRDYVVTNEGSYLPDMKRTWFVSERIRHGLYRPRSSFVTRPDTKITAEFLRYQLLRVEWPDAAPIEVEAEEYPAENRAA